MRIFSAVQSDIVDRAARDLGFIRTRDELRAVQGLGFAASFTESPGAAGDEHNVGLRLQAGGTVRIVVERIVYTTSVSTETAVYMNTGALPAPTVTALAAGFSRLASSGNDAQAEFIQQRGAGIIPSGFSLFRIGGNPANTPYTIFGPFMVDVALEAVTVLFMDLGAGTAMMGWHWYEE